MNSSEKNNSYNPIAVTASILLADGILFALAYYGEDHCIGGVSAGNSICPALDSFVNGNCLKSIAIILHVATAAAAIYWHRKEITRDVFNILLLTETIIAFGWWTAHTGGLSQSIHGPAFLALFPVATIVPRATSVKVILAIIVATIALLIAWNAPDQSRELFIWCGSIIGCSIGWIIQTFLDNLKAREDS